MCKPKMLAPYKNLNCLTGRLCREWFGQLTFQFGKCDDSKRYVLNANEKHRYIIACPKRLDAAGLCDRRYLR